MSDWQQRIEGDWHGIPSVFTADGAHAGFIRVSRASRSEGGRTTYYMNTALELPGAIGARFSARDFAFGVDDGDRDRVYLGPDFFGAGQPTGAVVDAHYYSPGWQTDLHTLVHVLPDGKTQAYSSQLFEGPTLVAVFNGLYLNGAPADVEPFVAAERARGGQPHVLPFKQAGTWSGELTVHDAEHRPLGTAQARIGYRPLSLLRAAVEVQLEGAITRRWRYDRSRQAHRHFYEGPDVYGNATAYGRALYFTQHVTARAESLTGREFLLDDRYSLSVVWKLAQSGRPSHLLYGTLAFTPAP
jgi:hypothetical protein